MSFALSLASTRGAPSNQRIGRHAGTSAASNGLSLWLPQIIKSFGLNNVQTGWLNAFPFAVASVAMIWWGNRSDKKRERIWSTAVPLGLSACALGACVMTTQLLPTILFLALTLVGTYAFKGPFWALSTERLGPPAAAAGLAQINAVGNLAGFGGTYLIGLIKEMTGSFALALRPVLILQLFGLSLLLASSCRAQPAPGRARASACPERFSACRARRGVLPAAATCLHGAAPGRFVLPWARIRSSDLQARSPL